MNEVQHARWCITQCPMNPAERTVWWFISGRKEWDVHEAMNKYNFISKQLRNSNGQS